MGIDKFCTTVVTRTTIAILYYKYVLLDNGRSN